MLILSVIVLMCLAFLKPLHKGFLTLGQGLFGTQGYFSCLLKTGLLPGQTTGIENCKSQAEIQSEFKEDISKMGVELPSGGGGGSKAPPLSPQAPDATPPVSQGRGGGDNSGRSTKIPISRSQNPTSPSPGGRRGGGRTSASRSGLMPLSSKDKDSSGQTKLKKASEGAGGESKKKFGYKNTGASGSENGRTYRVRRVGGFHSSGFMEQEERKKASPIPVRLPATKKGFQASKKKQLLPLSQTKKHKEIKDKAWSFGSFIRILLIVCIILILVLIVGSQSFQVKKSMK